MELIGILFQIIFNAFAFLFGLILTIITKIWPVLIVIAIIFVFRIGKVFFTKQKK